jgi:hypothetical protein
MHVWMDGWMDRQKKMNFLSQSCVETRRPSAVHVFVIRMYVCVCVM